MQTVVPMVSLPGELSLLFGSARTHTHTHIGQAKLFADCKYAVPSLHHAGLVAGVQLPSANRPWCSQLGADAAKVPTQVVLLLYLEQPCCNECACVSQAGLLHSAGVMTKVVTTMTNHLSMYDSSCTLLHGRHTCTAQLLYVILDMGESIVHMSVECSLCTLIHQGAVQGCNTRYAEHFVTFAWP